MQLRIDSGLDQGASSRGNKRKVLIQLAGGLAMECKRGKKTPRFWM